MIKRTAVRIAYALVNLAIYAVTRHFWGPDAGEAALLALILTDLDLFRHELHQSREDQ